MQRDDALGRAAALHAAGRYPEALEAARHAIELDPASRGARITAAFIEGTLSGYDVALTQIDELLATTPSDPAALAARCYCLLQLERYDAAATSAERGLAAAPGNGLLLQSYGCALRGLGRFDEAFAAFDRTLAAGHDRAATLVLKGSGLLESGRFDEAERAFDAALEIAPGLASAWSALAEMRAFAPDDLARLETLLETSPDLRALEPRTLMHFALGKAYRKTGNHRAAFRHLEAGNALKRGTLAYDVAGDERFAAETIAFFTPDRMRELGGRGDPSAAPIFVVGMPRSGTTLVEQILASHPGVYGAGELTLFERALEETGSSDPAALGARYLALVRTIAPADKRVVDKLPSNFRHVALLHVALPRARFVHCVRDALDTCFSCYSTLFTGRQDFSWDLTETGRYYRAYAALMAHWRAILPPGIMLDVRYEELVAHLEEGARRLLAFCGLPWDEAVLRYYETSRTIRTASFKQARQPIYTTSIGAAEPYRTELAPLITALGGA